MASKNLSFVLTGIDQSASATLGAVGLKGENTASKLSGTFSKMGGMLGGEFGELGEKIGAIFEKAGDEGTKMGTKVAAAGAAVTGIGAILTNMGSADKQAQDQLKQAIENTNNSFADYAEEIEKAIKQQENFGHSAVDTQNALMKLTTATNDPKKALDDMGVVANLAAAKHEALGDAATQVARVLSGTGGKTLAQYGIVMGNTGDKTVDAQNALQQLAAKLDGQASASMDNWSSKVDVAKVKIEDWAAKIGEKLGPAITAAGPVLLAAGVAMDLYQGHVERAAAAQLAMAATVGEADATIVAENEAAEASSLALGPIGVALGAVTLAAGAAGIAYKLFGGGAKEAAKPVEDLTAAIKEDAGALGEHTRAVELDRLNTDGLYKTANQAGVAVGTVTDAVMGNSDAMAQLKAIQEGLEAATAIHTVTVGKNTTSVAGGTKAQMDQKIAIDKLIDSVNKEKASLDASQVSAANAAGAAAAAAVSTNSLATAQSNLTADATALTAAYDAQLTALDNLQGVMLSAQESSLQYKDALAALTTQVQQAAKSNEAGARSLDTNTAAGRANAESIDGLLKRAQDQATTSLKQGQSVDVVTKAYASNVAQIEATAVQAGLSKKTVDQYIASLKATPKDIETTLTANVNVNIAQVTADAVNKKLVAINQHASGGVIGGQTFDEYGLEGLNLPNDTTVIPHGQTQQMMRGMGGAAPQINITYQSWTGPTAEDGKRLVETINMALQQHGAGPLRAPWLSTS